MDARYTSPPKTDTERVLLYLVRTGILIVLFTPLVVTTSTLYPFIVGKAVFSRTVIEITFALWVMLALTYPTYRLRRSWVLVAVAVWIAMSIVAGFSGVSLQRSLWSTYERMQGIFDQVHWFAFMIVAASVFRNVTHWKLLFSVNLGFSVVVSLLGAAKMYDLVDWIWLGSGIRVESTLGNATYVGAYAMVNIFLALAMIAHTWRELSTSDADHQAVGGRAARRRKRSSRRSEPDFDYSPVFMSLWLSAILVNLWALWLALARGAIFGLLSGIVLFALVYLLWGQIHAVKRMAYGIFGIVVAVLVLFVLARATPVFDPAVESNPMLTRLVSTGFNDNSIRGRVTSWRVGAEAYLDKPIFGWGPENYLIAWGRHFDSASGVRERFDQAHNKVLEELTTKGVVGAISYLAIWAAMGWTMFRAFRRTHQQEQVFVALVAAAMVGFFAQNLFLFDSPVVSLQFAILVAFAIREEMYKPTGEESMENRSTPDREPASPTERRQSILDDLTGWFSAADWRTVGSTFGAGLIAVVLVFSLLLNLRTFSGAKYAHKTNSPTISWDMRLSYFEESIKHSPFLANYSRMFLINQVSNNMQRMTKDELARALEFIELQAEPSLKAEPENWRINVLLAGFYQNASERINREYLKKAREYLDEAIRLAPRTLDVVIVQERQDILEGQTSGS